MFSLLHPSDIDNIHGGALSNMADLHDMSDWWLNSFVTSKYSLDITEALFNDEIDKLHSVMTAPYLLMFVQLFIEGEFDFLTIRSINRSGYEGMDIKQRVFYINQSMFLGIIADNDNNTIVGELNTNKPKGYQPCKRKKLA